MKTKKEIISDTICDMVSDLLYYNRREDEELDVGDIEKEIREGRLTKDEIVEMFREELERGIAE